MLTADRSVLKSERAGPGGQRTRADTFRFDPPGRKPQRVLLK
jgi:hypothetical protein